VVEYSAGSVQRHFWLLHEIFPDSPIGNEAIVLRLRGALDAEALQHALDRVVSRHEALRTGFRRIGEEVVASINPAPVHCPLRRLDLSDLNVGTRARAVSDLLDLERTLRFDLGVPPLMRVVLVKESPRDHLLVAVFHHIVADGISLLQIFPAELAACYDAVSARDEQSLPQAPTAGPRTFALAERTDERRAQAALDRLFWRNELAGAPVAISLPTDKPHPPRRTLRGVQTERRLQADQRTSVVEAAARLDVRPADVLAAAFVALLARYSEESDIVLGTPIANRTPDLERAIGCFINVLVLRLRFGEATSFVDLARQVRMRRHEARAHAALHLGDILAERSAGHDPTRSPVYQVMFNYLTVPTGLPVKMAGIAIDTWRPKSGTAFLDLSLDVTEETSGTFLLNLEANGDVFDQAHVERMLEHYVVLLEAALRDPAEKLWRLPYLPDGERETIEHALRGPVLPELPDMPAGFHEFLRARGAGFGDRTAARSSSRSLTYRALQAEANVLAHYLIRRGIVPGDRVLVGPGHDPCDTLVVILGVLAAGAAFVPLDPSAPVARRLALSADSGARCLVACPGFDDDGCPPQLERFPYDGRAVGSLGLSPAPPPVLVQPGDLAYLMYTSGSTGAPKGVLVSHRNLVSQTRARLDRYDDPPGVLLATYSFAFDSSLAGLSWALATGGELRFATETERRDPVRLREIIARDGVTHVDFVPSMYAALLESAHAGDLDQLRVVVSGGEELPADLVERHWRTLPHARLYNEYGPTEGTVFATVHEVPRGEIASRTPIGRPIAGTECWILDRHGESVPLGHVGELCLTGAGVALGYHGRPEETARAFATPAAGPAVGRRLYRTGDRVRLGEDGLVRIVGRTDDQVQFRGYRVELGEIEETLRGAPQVKDAAAMARSDGTGPMRIVAYVVFEGATPAPQDTNGDAVAAVRRHLTTHLPSYMIPWRVIPIDQLPRTPQGKIDRGSLPDPFFEERSAPNRTDPPRSATERQLALLWQHLLGRSSVGPHDDFFVLGGDSLQTLLMLAAVEKQHGVVVPLGRFARIPTLAALAALVESRRKADGESEQMVIPVQAGDGPPLWVIHPIGGHVIFTERLRHYMDPRQPIIGIQSRGIEGSTPPLERIEDMADLYCKLIRSHQPRGPYLIVGSSMGGLIALEIGHRLMEQNERVALLGLLDTWGPGYPRRTTLPIRVLDGMREILSHYRTPVALLAEVRRKVERVLHRKPRGQPTAYYDAVLGMKNGGAIIDAVAAVTRANERAAANHRIRPYPGRVALLRATRTFRWPGMRFDNETNGFGGIAVGGVESVPIAGTHMDMLDEPQLAEVARNLQRLIDAAAVRGGGKRTSHQDVVR